MKRSHICPKCGGRDILRVPGKSGAYGAGNNIQSTGMSAAAAVIRKNGSTPPTWNA